MADIRQSPELTINRVPTGLSGLIDTKSQGTGPFVMDSRIQGAVLMNNFYEQQGMFGGFGATSLITAPGIWPETVATGSYNSSTVPTGEIWRLTSAGCRLVSVLAAGTTYTVAIGIRQNKAGLFSEQSLAPLQSFTAGQWVFSGWTGSLWMKEGDQLAVMCSEHAAAATDRAFRLDFTCYRYRV